MTPGIQAEPLYAPRTIGPGKGQSARTKAAAPPQPLTEPLPRVESILIDGNRRLALVDGAIVGAGDAIGRALSSTSIARRRCLREPPGVEVRVVLGGSAPKRDI